jgi:arabinogalactan endo-1,4-beta-galactosidase
MSMKLLLPLVSVLAIAFALTPALSIADDKSPFMLGADMSLLKFIEDHGVQYKDAGVPGDALKIFKDHGGNYVRLRLFLDPNGKEGQVNSLPYTLELAKRVKQTGLKFLLDLHYSDGWADPGHQITPAAWKNLSHAQLIDEVFTYTRDTLAAFRKAGATPDMVEVGNEITAGFLWPDGRNNTDANWNDFTDLLKAAIRGVHSGDDPNPIKILIHIDRGNNQGVSKWFFDHLLAHHVPFDFIGLSYYPFWNSSLAELKANLAFVANTYHKDIIVAETAYNWRGENIKSMPYPSTPSGQEAYLADLIRTVDATPDSHGMGVFYWAAEWIEGSKWGPGWSKDWENRAFFDDQGNALPVMDAYRDAARSP